MEWFICICCNRRKEKGEAHIAEKYLGICNDCNEKLLYIPEDAVFMGNEDLSSVFSVFYYKGIIRNTIRKYKFQGQQRYVNIFVELMYDYLKNLKLCESYDLVTMVPLSRKRLYERGYNQTELIAEPLARKLGIEFSNNCVFKKRNNKIQSRTNNSIQRRENVKDAYIADFRKVTGKNILLVDDVYTSGATLKSCAKELKQRGAESVLGITLAKTINKHVY